MHTFFFPDGPLLVFPMRGQRIRLIAQVAAAEAGSADETSLGRLQAIADERAVAARVITAATIATNLGTLDKRFEQAGVDAYLKLIG
jgi:hypothetical protein